MWEYTGLFKQDQDTPLISSLHTTLWLYVLIELPSVCRCLSEAPTMSCTASVQTLYHTCDPNIPAQAHRCFLLLWLIKPLLRLTLTEAVMGTGWTSILFHASRTRRHSVDSTTVRLWRTAWREVQVWTLWTWIHKFVLLSLWKHLYSIEQCWQNSPL